MDRHLNLSYIIVCLSLLVIASPRAEAECTKVLVSPSQFRSTFLDRRESCAVKVQGLVGRVLRGKSDADFSSLSDDPEREVVFLLGNDGLAKIVGMNETEALNQIGYPKDYVNDLKKRGYRFKLVVFTPENGQQLATWDHVFKLVEEAYPSISGKLRAHELELKNRSFASIQSSGPRKFAEIEREGVSNPEYINLKRLEERRGTVWEVRAFLFNVVHLNELFTGDGRTRLEDGKPGAQEYISRNTKISDLKNAAVVDLRPAHE